MMKKFLRILSFKEKSPLIIMTTLGLVVLLMGSMSFGATKWKSSNTDRNLVLLSKPFSPGFMMRWSTISNFQFPVTNYGILGHNVPAGIAGGIWPRGSGNAYIFGGGVWFATIKEGHKYVAVGYNPNSGESHFCPGPIRFDAEGNIIRKWEDNPEDILYFSTDYDTLGNALASAPDFAQGTTWPIRDANGKPVYVSGQDMYCVYNDADPSYDSEYGPASQPLDIEIHQTVYTWGLPFAKDYFFVIYDVINRSGTLLDSCWLAPAYDPDIGDAGDDRVAFYEEDPSLNLGYVYDNDGDEGWANPPGVLGCDFLESPIDPNTGEQLGLVTWRNWVIENDPKTDAARYDFMSAGTKDPDTAPGDKRFCAATGPFALADGDTARVVVAFVMGKDLETMVSNDKLAQGIYDSNFETPKPPDTPTLTATPLDHAVLLSWDDIAEKSNDPLTENLDFKGYRLYRSRTGMAGSWELLAQWDVKEGPPIEHSYLDLGDDANGDGVYDFTERLINGVTYYYYLAAYDEGDLSVPSLETPVQPGKNSVNTIPKCARGDIADSKLPSALTLTQGGYLGNVSNPQLLIKDQTKFNQLFAGHVIDMRVTRVGSDGTEYLMGISVIDTTTNTVLSNHTIMTGVKQEGAGEEETLVKGSFSSDLIWGCLQAKLNYEFTQLTEPFALDTFYISQGDADVPLILRDQLFGTTNTGEATYEVEFLPGGTLSNGWNYLGMKVTNLLSGQELGKDYWVPSHAETFGPIGHYIIENGEYTGFVFSYAGWDPIFEGAPDHVYCTTSVVDTITYTFSHYICLCGYRIRMDYGGLYSDGGTKDFEAGDKITIKFRGGVRGPFPTVGTTLRAVATPASALTSKSDVEKALEKIKIVPNPYLVGHIAQRSGDYARLFFVGLPAECDIHIYTVAGDKVATIHHNNGEGTDEWNILSDGRQRIVSGVYLAYIKESKTGASVIKKFAIVRGGFRHIR